MGRSKEEDLPFLTVRRILQKAGVKRIDEEGVEELIKILKEAGMKIAKEAVVLAHYAPRAPSTKPRKTVVAEDIAIAATRVLKESEVS